MHRMKREFNLDVNVGRPQVVYRETVTTQSQATVTFDRELGGDRQVGEVTLDLKPNPPGRRQHL